MKTIKIKNSEVAEALKRVQETANAELADPKIAYAVAKTLELLEREAKAIEAACEPPKAFVKDRDELVKKHAERDDKGKMKTQTVGPNRVIHVIANQRAYDEEFETLRTKHNIAEFEQKTEDFLATEADFEFYPIPLKKDECPWKQPKLLANVLRFAAE